MECFFNESQTFSASPEFEEQRELLDCRISGDFRTATEKFSNINLGKSFIFAYNGAHAVAMKVGPKSALFMGWVVETNSLVPDPKLITLLGITAVTPVLTHIKFERMSIYEAAGNLLDSLRPVNFEFEVDTSYQEGNGVIQYTIRDKTLGSAMVVLMPANSIKFKASMYAVNSKGQRVEIAVWKRQNKTSGKWVWRFPPTDVQDFVQNVEDSLSRL